MTDSASQRADAAFSRGAGLLSLWAGLMAGPVAWVLHELVGFALVPWACGTDRAYVLHVVTASALALAIVGGLVAFHKWRETGEGWPEDAPGAVARARFMAVGGMLLSAMFVLVIVAQESASWFLGPCQ